MKEALAEIWDDLWAELKRATADKRHPFRYFTFGTSSDKGPNLRTVVLRGIDNHVLEIHTDYRSVKVSDILNKEDVSCLFYHPRKKIQLRLNGTAELIRNGALDRSNWNKMSEHARRAYQFTVPPGEKIASPEEAHIWTAGEDYYTIIKVTIVAVDYLKLNRLEHTRAAWAYDNQWHASFIAP
jgi:hypothetical protein